MAAQRKGQGRTQQPKRPRRKRPPKCRGPKAAARVLETTDALELRIAGHGYREIAKALGQPLATVYQRIQAELRELPREAREEVARMEHERLDKMHERLELRASLGDHQAIAVQLRISERRCSMFGVDAPSRIKLEGETDDLDQQTRDFLEGLRAEAAAQEAKGGGHDQSVPTGGPPADPGPVDPGSQPIDPLAH